MRTIRKLFLILLLVMAMGAGASEPQIVVDALSEAEWAARALTSSGYKADFSMDSLKEVDRFFDEHAPEGKPTPDGLLSKSVGSRLFAVGSYIGETIRRNVGGSWQGDDADPRAEINVGILLKSGETFWPIQRAMKRFQNGSEDGIYAYGVVIADMAAADK